MNVSDAMLLAPEEVYDKKKAPVKGETELDQAERKRLRAAKKRAKKGEVAARAKAKEVKERMNPALASRQKKESAVATLVGQKVFIWLGWRGRMECGFANFFFFFFPILSLTRFAHILFNGTTIEYYLHRQGRQQAVSSQEERCAGGQKGEQIEAVRELDGITSSRASQHSINLLHYVLHCNKFHPFVTFFFFFVSLRGRGKGH